VGSAITAVCLNMACVLCACTWLVCCVLAHGLCAVCLHTACVLCACACLVCCVLAHGLHVVKPGLLCVGGTAIERTWPDKCISTHDMALSDMLLALLESERSKEALASTTRAAPLLHSTRCMLGCSSLVGNILNGVRLTLARHFSTFSRDTCLS
jgi:hypothetical protein